MWNPFASNGTSVDDLVKDNQRLSEHLSIILEDYELLKEAHRRVLEQMLPIPSNSSQPDMLAAGMLARLDQVSQQVQRLEESEVGKTLIALVDGDLRTLVNQCVQEKLALGKLKESLRLKQEEIAEQEFDLSRSLHELRCRETDPNLEQAVLQVAELQQNIDQGKREAEKKDLQIADLKKQLMTDAGRKSQDFNEAARLKRALSRVADELTQLKTRCRFDDFRKQLLATKDFFTSELQRLSRRVAGLFKEKQKLQERLEVERKTWRETELNLKAKHKFEVEELQRRLNKTLIHRSTQTEDYFEEVDHQQSEMWGADFEVDWNPEVVAPLPDEKKPSKDDPGTTELQTQPVAKSSYIRKKPQQTGDSLEGLMSELSSEHQSTTTS